MCQLKYSVSRRWRYRGRERPLSAWAAPRASMVEGATGIQALVPSQV